MNRKAWLVRWGLFSGVLACSLLACEKSGGDGPTAAEPEPPVAETAVQAQPEAPSGGTDEAPKTEPTAPVAEADPPPSEKAPDTVRVKATTPTAKPATLALAPTVAKATPTANAKPEATATPAPEPAAETRKVVTVRGSSHSADSFALSISARSPVRAGESGSANIVLSAKAPFKCNLKYPYRFTLDAPSGGISYPSTVVRNMSLGEKTSTMSVPFSTSQKGRGTIKGTLSFSVCTDDKCLIEKRPLAVTVDVD